MGSSTGRDYNAAVVLNQRTTDFVIFFEALGTW
jgi:hypothetical protein